MRVLGIETSTYSSSVAITDGDKALGELLFNFGPRNSEKLVPMVDWLLREVGMDIREVEGIAVSVGPGSFTALRVGISAAKGLAFSLGIPVAGISSLQVLAGNLPFASAVVCPMIDAKKKEVFAAFFKSSDGLLSRVSEDFMISPQTLCEMVEEKTVFIGDGAALYGALLEDSLGELALFCPANFNLPRASNCALMGGQKLKNDCKDDLYTLTPKYLRQAEIKIHKEGVIT